MSVIKPFKALRPARPTLVEKIACAPYDVPYDSEVREVFAENPQSFLRVTRAEAEFPLDEKATNEQVLERSKENLEMFIREGWLAQDEEPSVYIYRLSIDGQVQTGIVACCSIDEYDQGLIKKHEKTRPDKVKDRTDHMIALNAQTGLIFLTFRNTDRIREIIKTETAKEPLFVCPCDAGGVTQTVWRVSERDALVDAFGELPALYVADGHHRAESASLARHMISEERIAHTGQEEYNFVMAGMFPSEDLKILPYNRIVKDLNGLSEAEFLTKLADVFDVTESGVKDPAKRGDISMFLGGKWYTLAFKGDIASLDAIERLDVSILQQNVLTPILNIDDPRTNNRVAFVGGIRGTDELERLVDGGDAAAAFSMYATSMDDLLAVADVNEIMPPKSTWFEPKLKDGGCVHRF